MRTFFLLLFFLPVCLFSQPQQQPDAAHIKLKLKKLNFLGAVLYMAAHPDDENTNIIAYLANHKLASTAYLSMTRGDGGQNLIGPEIGELLGLIRTQELLAARNIDGGQQFFTRAIDFGFSKSAAEALSVWGKDAVLSDAVKIVRQYQPDIIITRFPPDERAGHGHHTASAIVAGEAFELAAKAEVFPEQLKELTTWQVKRLYTNTGRWWNTKIDANTPGIITLDVGGFNPLLGKSYSEVSALSSSQHKSQGWGRGGERGYRPEFLEYMKGDRAIKDIFEGIDTTWARVPGGKKIQPLVERALQEFDEEKPSAIVPLLFRIRNEIAGLGNSVWKKRKLQETEQLIENCLGLFIEVTAAHYQSPPGESVQSSVELLNRCPMDLKILKITGTGLQWDSTLSASLRINSPIVINLKAPVSTDASYSGQYWLQSSHGTGLFTVNDPVKIGLPQNHPAVNFSFEILVGAEKLTVSRPMIYQWVDPVKGELWRPFEIVPPMSINLSENVLIFNSGEAKKINLFLKSSTDQKLRGTATLKLPQGWSCEPNVIDFDLPQRGAEQTRSLVVHPSQKEYNGNIMAVAEVNGKQYDQSLQMISYDHFPIQTLLHPAQTKVVRIDLNKEGTSIGYIRGAGDEVPSALRNMGYEVWEMNNDEVTPANLRTMDAVVLGIRALNTNDRAPYFMPAVLDYVKSGGTVVVQYNTNARMDTEEFFPYPLKLSRERVTQENSEVKILKPDHPVVNTPNKITQADFKGWVQERGLYFPDQWDAKFEAILSMQDDGETPKNGSLLVAKYGDGYYVYTALSFFRELPEGVPGAYKLLANIVSLGKNAKQEDAPIQDRNK
ncbi:MAG: PIG-L family deacetylase [Cyclobacteriaceae bacterium]